MAAGYAAWGTQAGDFADARSYMRQ